MRYTYLLTDLLTLLFPVILSFDKKVQFYKSGKFIWPGLLITGLLFCGWDALFTAKGVWAFNKNYITGLMIGNLPVEEVLFFFAVPFACLFIYECLNYYFKREINQRVNIIISNPLIAFSLCMLLVYPHRLYTQVTFGLLAVLLIWVQYFLKPKWLLRFYLAFVVALIPFYVINGILTSLPVVIYNNVENMDKRIGNIPLEDYFYCMALLLLNVAFFEYFRNRKTTA